MRRITYLFLIILIVFLDRNVYAQCNLTFELGNDTTLDCGVTLNIAAPTGLNRYEWSNNSNNQSINVNQPGGTYWCVGYEYLSNLVTNGDFTAGDVGFQSNYVYGTGGPWGVLSNEGEYAVTSNTSLVHNNFPSCFDHTVGNATGSMMVVNGSNTAGQNVWEQTITVLPNTSYTFAAWAMTVVASNPAQLSFSINGSQIGNTFNLSATTCQWQQFTTIWNSGTSTSATIAIVNQNTSTGGNDFALDDISFASVCEYSDTITVSYPDPPVLTLLQDDTLCRGDSLLLVAQTDIPINSINWFHGAPNTDSLYVSPTNSTIYSASATSTRNCVSPPASVFITVVDKPTITASTDEVICFGDSAEISFTASEQLASFAWSPALPDTNFVRVSPADTTQYIIIGENEAGCEATDSVTVNVTPTPIVAFAVDDFALCRGDSALLTLQYDTSLGTRFIWSGRSLNEDTVVITPTNDTTLTIRIEQNRCRSGVDSATISVQEIPALEPLESIVICPDDEFILTTNSTVPEATINWLPLNTTGDQFVHRSTESLRVRAYAEISGCVSDSVFADIIISDTCLCVWYMPNVFTPNGDEVNDGFGFVDLNESCELQAFELVIFNRWGKKVWDSIDATEVWDGSNNGNESAEGTYFWKLKFIDQRGTSFDETGTVTLLK